VTSSSHSLWREFSILTGKVLDSRFARNECQTSDYCKVISTGDETSLGGTLRPVGQVIGASSEDNLYRRYYFRNPCVPIDFDTITEALQHCPKLRADDMSLLSDETVLYSGVGTVVLSPGVYAERVTIHGVSSPGEEDDVQGRVAIRAAFPMIGATIQSPVLSEASSLARRNKYDESEEALVDDQPCISITTCDDDTLENRSRGVRVDLSYLQIRHSSRRGVSA
jgi:hypothetical protein